MFSLWEVEKLVHFIAVCNDNIKTFNILCTSVIEGTNICSIKGFFVHPWRSNYFCKTSSSQKHCWTCQFKFSIYLKSNLKSHFVAYRVLQKKDVTLLSTGKNPYLISAIFFLLKIPDFETYKKLTILHLYLQTSERVIRDYS
jgi:hypothetical protein